MKVVFLNHQRLSILGTLISLEWYCMLVRVLFFFFSLKPHPGIPSWYSGKDSVLSLQASWVPFLVKELGSCMPRSVVKK